MWKGERTIGSREIREALGGDRSPQSFAGASVLIRNMTGSGPETDGGRWYSHDLVGAPTDENELWIQEEVFCHDDLQPNVVISRDGTATVTFFTVTFFTVSRLNQVRLVRHRDCSHPGSYSYRPSDDPSAVETLVELGALLEATENQGRTALLVVCECGRPSQVSSPIRLGSNIQHRDSKGRSAEECTANHHSSRQAQLIRKQLNK